MKVKIVLAGDSTVTGTDGWGRGFAACLTDRAECINMAQCGRSSKSFIAEGWWKKCLDLTPDYILIQFGHNDEPGKGEDRETDPQTSYRQFITRYVDEARVVGIKPVLVTSLSRRTSGADGKIRSTLYPYVEVVKEIASEKKIPLIDLHAISIALYEKLGREGVLEISPLIASDAIAQISDATAPAGTEYDGTHLNARGSEIIGPIAAAELKKAVPALAPYIN